LEDHVQCFLSGDHAVTPTTDPALAEAVRRLVAVYSPELVYLFGSVARGEGTADSDYDLLIVVPDGSPPVLRRPGKGYEALWGLGAPVDVIVWTRSDFDDRLHLRASLPATVVREGILLHAVA
jgi:predicted nucleotidyltransferase